MTLNQKSLRQWHACMNMNYVTSNQYHAFDDLILEKKIVWDLIYPRLSAQKVTDYASLSSMFF